MKYKVLITGMPFSGKTYIAEYINQKEEAHDADSISGLGRWYDNSNNVVNFPQGATKEWLDNHEFRWDINVLEKWLEEQKNTVYLFGLSANVFDTKKLFDRAYYLHMEPETLIKRFQNNTRENPMGKTEEQQKAILRDLFQFTKDAEKYGFIRLEANDTPKNIYKKIKSKA